MVNSENGLELVKKEQAVKLKVLGFDWPTEHLFLEQEETVFDDGKVYPKDNHNAYGDATYSAPEIALAIKWLRKKLNVFVSVETDFSDPNNIVHNAVIRNEVYKTLKISSYFDHEAAERNGLQLALEYLLTLRI